MDFEPERTEAYFFVRYCDAAGKKTFTTRWRMTEVQAKEKFGEHQYELVLSSREDRRIGGDPLQLTMKYPDSGKPSK